ncbi:MAG: BatA domain-containing protein [Gemmatimonadaceae bacterium]|nr:BatA domain-containing protein [Gemmatimonadaceae bacterium]
MTFLAPIFLYIGMAVAAGAVALHFIVTRQPTSSPLPTVRFIPVSSVRVTTVAPVPEDLWVLLIRVLAALLIGAAFARPVLVPERRPVARVVLADVSRGVAQIEEVRDSSRRLLADGDALIAFDSAPREITNFADSLATLRKSGAEAKLSPALIAALRTASELRAAVDSIELVIVSPLRASALDGATHAVRALWPGRVRLVHVAASADTLAPQVGITVRAADNDGVAIAAKVAGIAASDAAVRLLRDTPTAADSSWAAAGRRALVRWPVAGAPPGWRARATVDTAGAVIAGDAALVYPLERRWEPDSAASPLRVVARWVDGEPAAVERAVGAGCVRDVAIPVPTRGDLVLRPSLGLLLRALGAPCESTTGSSAMAPADMLSLSGTGPLAASDAIEPPDTVTTPLVPWLLGAALFLALLEPLVRRGSPPLWDEDLSEEPVDQRGAA